MQASASGADPDKQKPKKPRKRKLSVIAATNAKNVKGQASSKNTGTKPGTAHANGQHMPEHPRYTTAGTAASANMQRTNSLPTTKAQQTAAQKKAIAAQNKLAASQKKTAAAAAKRNSKNFTQNKNANTMQPILSSRAPTAHPTVGTPSYMHTLNPVHAQRTTSTSSHIPTATTPTSSYSASYARPAMGSNLATTKTSVHQTTPLTGQRPTAQRPATALSPAHQQHMVRHQQQLYQQHHQQPNPMTIKPNTITANHRSVMTETDDRGPAWLRWLFADAANSECIQV